MKSDGSMSTEQMKSNLREILNFIQENDPEVKRSLEIFGLEEPGKKATDSVDQFLGNLRRWYEGHDPHASMRMTRMEEVQRFILGSVSGSPFREGDLEVLNRFRRERRDEVPRLPGERQFDE